MDVKNMLTPEEKIQFKKLRKELNQTVERLSRYGSPMSPMQKFMLKMKLSSNLKKAYNWSLKARQEYRYEQSIIDSLTNGRKEENPPKKIVVK